MPVRLPRGILLDANPALVQMLGYHSAAQLTGENLANLHRDPQQWFTVADCLRSLRPFKDLTSEWIGKDGKPITVRLSGSAIPGEGTSLAKKDALFFELFAEDVTDRRALEQQLRQAQKMEAVGRLAGGIAHDFNNLLMVISGYCEFLTERTTEDAELRGLVQEIARAAERAAALTRQLLTFSRKQMIAPKVVDLSTVVTENSKMLTRVIGEDIDLAMIPGANLGAVKADPSQIEQVIMNLAVNARDAMPSGGKLTIETSNVTLDESYARVHSPVRPGEFVMLAVSDSGMGMDAETQAHLFNFAHARRASKALKTSGFPRCMASSSKMTATSGCTASPARERRLRSICRGLLPQEIRFPRQAAAVRKPPPGRSAKSSSWSRMKTPCAISRASIYGQA